jgi:hypothetical protein
MDRPNLPAPWTSPDPDVLEKREGGGCLMVFGLPFFLVGLFILQIPLGILPVQASLGGSVWLFALLFGVPFTAIGGALMFGRSGLVLDRRKGEIVRWRGLLLPMKRTPVSLAGFHRVRLDRDSGGGESSAYGVRLAGDGPDGSFLVQSVQDYGEAHRLAEALAKFLGWPLEDRSTGKRVVREADRLDESLRDRVRRLKERLPEPPPPPPGMRTRVEQTVGGVVLVIPGSSMGAFRFVPLVFSLIFAGGVLTVFVLPLSTLPMPEGIRWVFLGFVGFFFVILPVWTAVRHFLRRSHAYARVEANRALLRIEESEGGKKRVTEIPADELEDLTLPDRRSMLETVEIPGKKRITGLGDTGTPRLPDGRPVPRVLLKIMEMVRSPGITARSDRAIVTFGRGLPEAEAAYVYALVLRAVAGD